MENYVINFSDYQILEKNKRTNQHKDTYRVEEILTSEQYVAKVCKRAFDSQEPLRRFMIEIKALTTAKHYAILEFTGYCFSKIEGEIRAIILTPFMKNGSLRENLDKEYIGQANPEWSSTKKLCCLLGTAAGMDYLHKIGIIHRNISPENIMLDDDFLPKICDFGVSKIIYTDEDFHQFLSITNSSLGTPLYMAPEVFDCEYSEKVDVYSFSMILYELFCNQKPDYKITNFVLLCQAVQRGERPDLSNLKDESQKRLIKKCWSSNPEKRPSFDKIMKELIDNMNTWFPDVEKEVVKDYLYDLNIQINSKEQLFNKAKSFFRESNFKAAQKYYLRAIHLGSIAAMYNYALMLQNGEGIEKNSNEAIKYYKMAIELGDCDSTYNCALIFQNGDDIQKNLPEAIRLYKLAIEHGNSNAMNNYALMLQKGEGVEKNIPEAVKYYQMAIKLGNSYAMNNYAYLLRYVMATKRSQNEAIKYYLRSVELGNSYAMNNYAYVLRRDTRVEKNSEESVKLLKQAIKIGNNIAMFNYGTMLRDGMGVPRNLQKAQKYFEMSYKCGNINASPYVGSKNIMR